MKFDIFENNLKVREQWNSFNAFLKIYLEGGSVKCQTYHEINLKICISLFICDYPYQSFNDLNDPHIQIVPRFILDGQGVEPLLILFWLNMVWFEPNWKSDNKILIFMIEFKLVKLNCKLYL